MKCSYFLENTWGDLIPFSESNGSTLTWWGPIVVASRFYFQILQLCVHFVVWCGPYGPYNWGWDPPLLPVPGYSQPQPHPHLHL